MLPFYTFENVHLKCTLGPPFQISKYATDIIKYYCLKLIAYIYKIITLKPYYRY